MENIFLYLHTRRQRLILAPQRNKTIPSSSDACLLKSVDISTQSFLVTKMFMLCITPEAKSLQLNIHTGPILSVVQRRTKDLITMMTIRTRGAGSRLRLSSLASKCKFQINQIQCNTLANSEVAIASTKVSLYYIGLTDSYLILWMNLCLSELLVVTSMITY